jgi:hypothetical protein
MRFKEYIDPEFKKLFNIKNNRTVFKALWNRNDPWFEEPNLGRRDSKSAWSGVARIQYNGDAFFLKKQENYFAYSVKPPFRQLVVQKEYANIQLFESLKIPCLDVVYFGVKKKLGKTRGMLITKALDNYLSLNAAQEQYCNFQETDQIQEQRRIKKAVIASIAQLIQKAHVSGLMHNCLYPKHIYIDKDFFNTGIQKQGNPVCRFIDLEGARKVAYKSKKQLRDLETLNRRLPTLNFKDKIYFLLQYLNTTSVDRNVRKVIKRIKDISR